MKKLATPGQLLCRRDLKGWICICGNDGRGDPWSTRQGNFSVPPFLFRVICLFGAFGPADVADHAVCKLISRVVCHFDLGICPATSRKQTIHRRCDLSHVFLPSSCFLCFSRFTCIFIWNCGARVSGCVELDVVAVFLQSVLIKDWCKF